MAGPSWFDGRVEKKEDPAEHSAWEEVDGSAAAGKDGGDLIERMDRFRRLSYKVRYYILFALILIMIGFIVVPQFMDSDEIHVTSPLDLVKQLYFRAEDGTWYRIKNITDDTMYDAVSDAMRGTYKMTGQVYKDRKVTSILVVCNKEAEPLRAFWFHDGVLAEPSGEELMKTFERQETPFSYDDFTALLTENGIVLKKEELPAWTADMEK